MRLETSRQSWSAQDYAAHAFFVPLLGQQVLDLLTVEAPARVLDLGCGDGALTQQLIERGFEVVGVDASESMVRAAVARGVDAHVADGHALPYERAEFDAVFSNATLHWLTRPADAIASVYRALRPGGQFVGELGGAGNVRKVVSALVSGLDARGLSGAAASPWYFPTPGDYATRLEKAGFRVESIMLFDRPTRLPGDVLDWIATFGQSFTHALPVKERATYLDEVRARLARELVDASGSWILDYVRLRFRALKPA